MVLPIFLNRREHGKIAKTIGGEGGRCAGKREKAGDALRYALNQEEKHKKAGAIEGEKEGP